MIREDRRSLHKTIIIIIIIIIILVINFMQNIYNYIRETNYIPRAYSVAGVLFLQFVLHVMLFRPEIRFIIKIIIIIIIIMLMVCPYVP